MTSRAKFSLLSLTAVVVIGIFLWMRTLVSWRPQKIGALPKTELPVVISSDGRLVTAFHVGSSPLNTSIYKNIDLTTGHSQEWAIKDLGTDNTNFGRAGEFYWSFERVNDSNFFLALKDIATGQLNHTLNWGSREYDFSPSIATIGRTLYVLSRHEIREFDGATDKLKRRVPLKPLLPSTVGFSTHLEISPDGKTLYGCCGRNGAVWDAQSGKLLKQWKATAIPSPQNCYLFSPDGRTVLYLSSPAFPTVCHFVDSTTGKLRWVSTLDQDVTGLFSDQNSEIVLPTLNGCEVHDLLTGQLKRKLPGPRHSDGHILRVSPGWIYTTNIKGEIFRWRAR